MVQTKKNLFGGQGDFTGLTDMMALNSSRSVGNEVEALQSDALVNRAIVEADCPHIQRLRAQIAARERQRDAMIRSGESSEALTRLDDADRADQAVIDDEATRLLDARTQILENPKGKMARRDPKLSVESVRHRHGPHQR